MKFTFISLIWFSGAVCGKMSHCDLQNYHNDLSEAVLDVVSNFYIKKTFHLFLFQAFNLVESERIENHLLNKILKETHAKVQVQVETTVDFTEMDVQRTYNVIFIDSYEAFLTIFERITLELFNYEGFYLIVIVVDIDQPQEEIQKVFNDLWTKYIVNVNIILRRISDSRILMYSYFPFGEDYCEQPKIVLLSEFNESFNITDYFPDKANNFHGCVLKVAVFTFAPFMIVRKDLQGLDRIEGIDANIIKAIGKSLKFKIGVVLSNDSWGVIYLNKTLTGSMKLTSEGKANLSIGCNRLRYDKAVVMKYGNSYYSTKAVWMIPPGAELTPLEKLLMPFDKRLWIGILVVFCLSASFVILINAKFKKYTQFLFGYKNRDSGLNIMGIILGVSCHRLPQRNFAKFILMMYVLYCLIIKSCYEGKMFDYLQSEFKHPPKNSMKEMLAKGYTFYCHVSAGTQVKSVVPADR